MIFFLVSSFVVGYLMMEPFNEEGRRFLDFLSHRRWERNDLDPL